MTNRFESIRVPLLTLFLAGAAFPALAQNGAPDAIDRYVEQEMVRERIPGLALGIYRDGKIIRTRGYGLANVELDAPVSAVTIFQSGSVGKQFAATAIMMLVEAKRLSLDDSLPRFFPNAPASWRAITVRRLLSHTSGLADYTDDKYTKKGGVIDYRADYTEDSLVRIIESFPSDFPPGEQWAYSNTNYVLLGAIIRKVTGQFYGDFLKERIFVPIGMTSTRIISEEDIVPHRAAGYVLKDGTLKNQEWVAPSLNTTADGAMYFNVADLAKWDEALYGKRLLKRTSLDTMWTVVKLNDGRPNDAGYGFGWGIHDLNGHRVIEHSGSWQGFTTFIGRYVDDTLTVVVLTNLDSDHSSPGKIAHAVARLYRPAIAYHAIPDSQPPITELVRSYFVSRTAAEPDAALVTPAFLARLKQSWSEARPVYVARGAPVSVVLVERPRGSRRSYRYLVTYKESVRVAEVWFGEGGRIDDARSSEY